jgi:RNA polymerase sigma factor (sigma-70 family)
MSDFQFDYSPMERLIDEKITGRKSARNREILKLRFLQGLTFAEIAEKMDMSEVQVGRIIHRYGDPLLIMLAK